MADEPSSKTQKSTPKGKDKSGNRFEPIEIQAPKRSTFENFVRRVAKDDGDRR